MKMHVKPTRHCFSIKILPAAPPTKGKEIFHHLFRGSYLYVFSPSCLM